MHKFTFVTFFVALFATLISAQDVPPSCLLKCVNTFVPGDFKGICDTSAGNVLVCLEDTCVGEFLDSAHKKLLETCKDKANINLDIKKALATVTTAALPTKTPGPKDDSASNADKPETDDKDDDKDSGAGKLTAGFVGLSALVMAVLAL